MYHYIRRTNVCMVDKVNLVMYSLVRCDQISCRSRYAMVTWPLFLQGMQMDAHKVMCSYVVW